MTTPKTMLESAVKLRDVFQERLVSNMVDVLFYDKLADRSPKDSQARIDAMNNVSQATVNVKNDTLLLECFDEIIKTLKK